MGKKYFSIEISKFSLALQPEALVNTSRRVLFSSPVKGPGIMNSLQGTINMPLIFFFDTITNIDNFCALDI